MDQKIYLIINLITIFIISLQVSSNSSSRSSRFANQSPYPSNIPPEMVNNYVKLFQEFCMDPNVDKTIIKCDEKFNKIYAFDKEKLTLKEASQTCSKKFLNLPFSSIVTFSNCEEYNLVKNFIIFVTESNQELWQDNHRVQVADSIPAVPRPVSVGFSDRLPSRGLSVAKRDVSSLSSDESASAEDESASAEDDQSEDGDASIVVTKRSNKKNQLVDVWIGGYVASNAFEEFRNHPGHEFEPSRHNHRWGDFIPGAGHEHDGQGWGRNWDKDCEDSESSETLEIELKTSDLILTEHRMVNVSNKDFDPWQDQKKRYTLCQLPIPKGLRFLWQNITFTTTTAAPTTETIKTSKLPPSTTTQKVVPKILTSTSRPPITGTRTLTRKFRPTPSSLPPLMLTTIKPTSAPTTRLPEGVRTSTMAPVITEVPKERLKPVHWPKFNWANCQQLPCPNGTVGIFWRCQNVDHNLCANVSFGKISDFIDKSSGNGDKMVEASKMLAKNMTKMKEPTGGDILQFIDCAKKIHDQMFPHESRAQPSEFHHPGHSVQHIIGTGRNLIKGFSAILDKKDAWNNIPKNQRTESAESVIERIHEMSVSIGCRTSSSSSDSSSDSSSFASADDDDGSGLIVNYHRKRNEWEEYEDYYRSKYEDKYHNHHKDKDHDHAKYHYDHFNGEAMKMAAINGSNIQMETFNLENGTISASFAFPKSSSASTKNSSSSSSADNEDGHDDEKIRSRSSIRFTNTVPVEEASCGAHVASGIIYQKIVDHLQDNLTSNDDDLSINTNLIAFSIRESSTESVKLPNNTMVMITLAHLDKIKFGDRIGCVFWNFDTNSWSGHGCRKVEELSFRNQTICECNHLTNFAALLDISNREDDDNVKNILTIVCSSLSVVCLTVTILLFIFIKSLRNRRSVITTNLSICLLSLNLLVMAGFDRTEEVILCRVISGVAMYAMLSAFSWMLMEGYFLYQMVIIVFRGVGQINTLWLYICGYGPAMIIVVSYVAITGFEGLYEENMSYFCWISSKHQTYHIWAVAGPGLVVIFINVVILIVSFKAALKSNRNKPNSVSSRSTISPSEDGKKEMKMKEIYRWFKGWTSLMVLVGLTWLTGLLYIHEWTSEANEEVIVDTDDGQDLEWVSRNRSTSSTSFPLAMSYLFIILNGSQGTFIFLFEIILNGKSRKQLTKLVRGKIPSAIKYLPSLSKTNSSQSNQSNQTTSRGTRSTASTTSGRSGENVVRITPDPAPVDHVMADGPRCHDHQ